MLKGIPKILSPELLKVLAEMGHSDRLVISDGNFPAESMGKDAIVIRCDGHGVPEILDAILQVFPLDTYVEKPVNLMEVMPGDNVETPIWIHIKRSLQNTMTEAQTQLAILNVLRSMMKQRKCMRSLQPVKQLFMQILCCRRVLWWIKIRMIKRERAFALFLDIN